MGYYRKSKEFDKKYEKELKGISEKEKVDLGVARAMLRANYDRGGKYSGGGTPSREREGDMQKDLSDLAKADEDRRKRKSSRTVNYPKTALASSSYTGGRSSSRSGATTYSSSYSPKDYTSEINRLAELQKQQAIAGLTKSKDTALSNLDREKADIQPRYYTARNDANTQSKLGAKSFVEYMANRRLTNSGENTQAKLMQNVALQGQIGELKQQEQSAFDEVGRRSTDVNNAYASDVEAARAGIDSQTMQNLINEQRRLDDIRREQDRYDREFNYRLDRDTVNDDRYDREFDYRSDRDGISDTRYNTQYRDQRGDIDYARRYQSERDSINDTRYNTEYADKRSDIDWARSPDNPAYQAQLLSNKMAEININYLPQQQQLELTKLRKQIAEIGREKPKSEYEMQLQKLKLAQVNKELENLNNPQNKPDKNAMIAGGYEALDSRIVNGDISEARSWLKDNRSNIISSVGRTEYDRMVKYLDDISGGY